MSVLGDTIRSLREQYGWSQAELGRRADVEYSTINAVESGAQQSIRSDRLKQLADTLGVTTDALLTGTVPMREAGMVIPAPIAELQAEGLPDSLVQDLVEKWPELAPADREAILSMHRAILSRYPAKHPGQRANGVTEAKPAAS